MSQYFFKIAMSLQHWGEVTATNDVKLWDPLLVELLHQSTTEVRRCHMLDQQLFLLLGYNCGVIHHEARPGQSWVETWALRAAVWYSKAWVRDVQRSWGHLVFIFKSCIVCVAWIKAKSSTQQRKEIHKEKGWKIPAIHSQSKDKMLCTKKQNCISHFN